MTPTKAHLDFWSGMAVRYSRRWYEDRGEKPKPEWCALLDKYTPQQLEMALEALTGREWYGGAGPDLPQFAALLASAALKAPSNGPDHTRGYWRSVVLADLERTGALVGLWRFGHRMSDLDENTRAFIMREARLLIDRACEMEREAGTRTPEIAINLSVRCWRLLSSLVPAERTTKRQCS
jgi:hypothetical protein